MLSFSNNYFQLMRMTVDHLLSITYIDQRPGKIARHPHRPHGKSTSPRSHINQLSAILSLSHSNWYRRLNPPGITDSAGDFNLMEIDNKNPFGSNTSQAIYLSCSVKIDIPRWLPRRITNSPHRKRPCEYITPNHMTKSMGTCARDSFAIGPPSVGKTTHQIRQT